MGHFLDAFDGNKHNKRAPSTTPLLGTATNPSRPPTMSAAPASGAAPAVKATSTDAATTPPKDQKPAAALEEDDEFEDFPVEGALRALPSLCGSHGAPPPILRQVGERGDEQQLMML